jgi:hypothetical protein
LKVRHTISRLRHWSLRIRTYHDHEKTDIALIIIIVSISAGLSYWVASATIGKANDKPIVVRTIDAIEVGDDSAKVDEKIFNNDAINPTVEANIKGEDLTSFMDAETSGDDSATNPGVQGEDDTPVVDDATTNSDRGE